MKKLLLSLLLVTQLSQNSFAQNWSLYKDFPVNVTPVDIDVNNAGTLFMLTLDYRIFYKPLNGQWTSLPISSGSFNPTCITVEKTSNYLFYGDRQGGLLYTNNFGVTWGQVYVTTGPNTGFHEDVNALSNVRNGDFFGGGTSGTDSNGNAGSFITRYTLSSTDMFVIDPTDQSGLTSPQGLIYTGNQKLVIGTYNRGIWITQNNGLSFQQTTFNQHQVSKFTEDTTGRVYALGTNLSTNQDFLLSSTDYINWTPMVLPNTTDDYTSIYFDATSNNLWLGSENGLYKVLVTPTSTTAWTSANFNNTNSPVVEIIGSNTGSMYNFSTDNIAQKLNAIGNNWSIINNGLTGNVSKVKFGQNDKLFAIDIFSNTISSANSTSANWVNNNFGGIATGISDIYTTSNGNLYANIYYNLKKSVDNGLTYTDITPPGITAAVFPPNFIYRFYVGETGNLFMVKSQERNKLYSSQNQGLTWSVLYTFTDDIYEISQNSNGILFVTLDDATAQSQHFFDVNYSTNNGVSWNVKTLFDEDSNGFGTLFSKSNKTYITIGNKAYKFDYIPNTNNFVLINKPADFVTSQFGLTQLKVNNLGHYYTFGNNLYKSINEGATWTNLGKPSNLTTNSVNDIFFDNNNQAYILASELAPINQRGIYTVTETLGLENQSLENTIAVYPNPAQNILNIQTQETVKKVAVYDVIGKKMNVSQISDKSIDVSDLAKGIYIVKITGENDKTFSTKFMKN